MRYLIVLLLAGCATTAEVTPYGGDSYLATAGDPGGTTATSTLQSKVAAQANAFCAERGKVMEVKDAKTSGNRWSGTNATLVFGCAAK